MLYAEIDQILHCQYVNECDVETEDRGDKKNERKTEGDIDKDNKEVPKPFGRSS